MKNWIQKIVANHIFIQIWFFNQVTKVSTFFWITIAIFILWFTSLRVPEVRTRAQSSERTFRNNIVQRVSHEVIISNGSHLQTKIFASQHSNSADNISYSGIKQDKQSFFFVPKTGKDSSDVKQSIFSSFCKKYHVNISVTNMPARKAHNSDPYRINHKEQPRKNIVKTCF